MTRPSNRERYGAMTAAIAGANYEALRGFCAADFIAELPGTGKLTFDGFVEELERQRQAFPDLGESVEIKDVVAAGDVVFAHYSMTVTFSGALGGWNGNSIEPTGMPIVISSMDKVVFDPSGRARELVVMSDRLETTNQLSS